MKYLAIRKHVKEKKAFIKHISIVIVDPLTKGILVMKFKDNVDRIGIISFM